ncbi:hypothetical protein F5Y19DRAFT_473912 [Xylariaceae sp. FL1651]|nr:hypothetical protein F5Y19DRAFT_473912 [Xylariaceae sp. FL1651]
MACTQLRTSTFVELGGSSYYVRVRKEASISHSQNAGLLANIVPLVVIHSDSSDVSSDFVQKSITRFDEVDDTPPNTEPSTVSSPGKGLVTITDYPPSDSLAELLRDKSLQLLVTDGSLNIPEGPYFVKGHNIHQAWRLFPDHLAAFTAAVIPDDRSEQPNLPLARARVSVKDNMHLKGIVTGLGNKTYAELYGKQNASARYIDSLIEQGATIVGKTKLSAFSGSEIPPIQCIDYFAPWNPQGDRFQGPSGSSSGVGASVAGSDWLDISICRYFMMASAP